MVTILVLILFSFPIIYIIVNSLYNQIQLRDGRKLKKLENRDVIKESGHWINEVIEYNNIYWGTERYMDYYPYEVVVSRMQKRKKRFGIFSIVFWSIAGIDVLILVLMCI